MARKIVIAFIALKGGAGKSTIAMALASEWSRRGYDVLIIDVDDQQRSVSKWANKRQRLGVQGSPTVIAMGENLETSFASVSRPYDVVIIDTPGRLGDRATMAMNEAQLVVMPCGPNGIEVESMDDTFQSVADVRRHHKKLDAAVLITKKITGTVSGRTAHRAYAEARFEPLETELDYLEDYGKAYDAGLGPTTWNLPGDCSRAIQTLTNELEKRLGMAPKQAAAPKRRSHLRAVK